MRLRILGVAAVVALTLSCEKTTAPGRTVSVSVPNPEEQITQGQTLIIPVTVTRVSQKPLTLDVTGLPSGVTATTTPSELGATLTLAATSIATPGPATVTITADGKGLESTSTDLVVTVLVAGAYDLVATPVSVQQGTSATTTLGVTRADGFAQDVALAISGLPTGVTASFDPSVATGTTSVITFSAAADAPIGTGTATVTGTTPGLPDRTTSIDITVLPPPSIAVQLSASSLELSRGNTGTFDVTVSRTNFQNDVTLSANGLPSGVSASFAPATLTGSATSSTVTLTASAGATLGMSTVEVQAAGTGVTTASANLALTVGPALTAVSVDFCSIDPALWFAYQNEGGAWTQVVPDANGTVSFNATATVGIAMTRQRRNPGGLVNPNSVITSIMYLSAAQVQSLANPCVNGYGTKTIGVSAAGIGATENWMLASGLTPSGPNSNATLSLTSTRKPDAGVLDFLGVRRSATNVPLAFIARRAVDAASGSTVPVFDFSTSEAVAADAFTYNLTGFNPLGGQIFVDFFTKTQGGTPPTHIRMQIPAAATSGTLAAVPSSLLSAGDRHEVTFNSGSGTNRSGVVAVFAAAAPLNLTIGPTLPAPTFTNLGPSRIRAQLPSQLEYGAMVRFLYNISGFGSVLTIEATAEYFGGTPPTWDLSIPDFAGVTGWNPAWALTSGSSSITAAYAASQAGLMLPPTWLEATIAPGIRALTNGTILGFGDRRATIIVP